MVRQAIVLDTNVVLDWLVFANPVSLAIGHSITQKRLRWVATTPMREELAMVLPRIAAHKLAHVEGVWASWNAHAELLDPASCIAPLHLRCLDHSDQKFIDLAVAHRAQWLISRDRAVLALAKRAKKLDVLIATPEQWLATDDRSLRGDS